MRGSLQVWCLTDKDTMTKPEQFTEIDLTEQNVLPKGGVTLPVCQE